MPKRYIFLSLMILAGTCIPGKFYAQRILGAISAGMNITQVDGDEYIGYYKLGLNIGPMVIVPLGKKSKWSISMELLYSQKGSFHYGLYDSTTFRLVQDYAEIPVLVHFTDKNLISGGVGFSYGQLINYKETKNQFYDTLFHYKTGLSNNDISVIADLKIRIWSKLWADLRYQYSMRSNRTVLVVYKNTIPQYQVTRKQYNNVISIRVTWVFNQPKTGNLPENVNKNQEQ